MYITSMRQPVGGFGRSPANESRRADEKNARIDAMLSCSDIGPQDRVLVSGHGIVDYLAGLSSVTCRSATGIVTQLLPMRREPAEVVWIVDAVDVAAEVGAALRAAGNPRMVTIELRSDSSAGQLQPVLQQLATRGLSQLSCQRGEGRTVVSARRPVSLEQAA